MSSYPVIVRHQAAGLATNMGSEEVNIVSSYQYYDEGAGILSVRLRPGEYKYVVAGRGNFVVYADDGGVWAIDLEVKGWEDTYAEETVKKFATWLNR